MSESGANREVARVLTELASLTKLDDGSTQSFRARAYERAADAVRSADGDIAGYDLAALRGLDGVGDGTARKIEEYLSTGRIEKLERLRSDYPPAFVELTRIPGVGPKTAVLLRDRLGVTSVDDLRSALADQRLRELPGLGARTEEKIGDAIERLGLHGKDRRAPIADALPVAESIVASLSAHPAAASVTFCGSLRRFRDTIGDIDILAASERPHEVSAAFVNLPSVQAVLAHGETKSAVLTREGFQVDLRVVAPGEFGAAELYFTGSKDHNIALRHRAIERGLLLNEYALSVVETEEVVAAETEALIYAALDLPFIAPPLREGRGEVEAAAAGRLPDLVEVADLRGDLHVHSTWSGDGRSSLADMIDAAAGRGLDYVAITEHGEDLAINGLSRDQVIAERREIESLREQYPDLTILHGAELNIGPDGSVDYDPDFLAGFDWCVASVHSHFDLPSEAQTERVIRAMANPAVNVIGHLTGRKIGRRPGIALDADAVFDSAAATGTALEINCHIDRLDVPADLLVRARDRSDILYVVSTDAHHTSEFGNARWGVRTAQRGWVDAARVANTWDRARFLEWARSEK